MRNKSREQIVEDLLRVDSYLGEIRVNVKFICKNYADIFHIPEERLEATHQTEHCIETIDDIPVVVKQYRFPQLLRQEVMKQIENLIDNNIVETSNSPYASPLWLVPKKEGSDGGKRWRLVIDYRLVNEKIISDAYPIPNINDILDELGGAKFFSVLDLALGFQQIPMRACDKAKTAFSTPFGHYQFKRMPFGLNNSPATFQRQIDALFKGMQGTDVFIYIDDLIIFSKTIEEHIDKFERVAQRMRSANMKFQAEKCEFFKLKVSYLGHEISYDGVKPFLKKVNAVLYFPVPRNPKNVRQFYGLANFYRCSIINFAKISKPLFQLLCKNTPFNWGPTQQRAFDKLKNLLVNRPLLQHLDFTKEYFFYYRCVRICDRSCVEPNNTGLRFASCLFFTTSEKRRN